MSGKTARLILVQISRGNYVPEELAKLAQASLKKKTAELAASLKGFYTEHFRWLLAESLQELAHLDGDCSRLISDSPDSCSPIRRRLCDCARFRESSSPRPL